MLYFEQLRIAGWRQFSQVELEFHRNITIITGANGAGKSTILNLLTQHFGTPRPYLGEPTNVNGVRTFVSNIFSLSSRIIRWIQPQTDTNWANIGSLTYSNDYSTPIQVPTQGQQSYGISFPQAQQVVGFHMPSHRTLPNYQAVQSVSFGGIAPQEAFGRLYQEVSTYFAGGHTGQSVLFKLKELLGTWAVFGRGNDLVGRNEAQLSAFDGYIEVLRKVLPQDLGFQSLRVDPPDVVVETTTGSFLIDSMSGGLLAIVEMSALIYSRTLQADGKDGFVVTLDEPENHLHPAMQRSIIPALLRAFPSVQFIIATHSPFVVTSAPDAAVYALKYEDVEISGSESKPSKPTSRLQSSRRVECIKLDMRTLSGSNSEILRDVLGVEVTYPVWVEDRMEAVINEYRHKDFNRATIDEFRNAIDQAGLAEAFPAALIKLGRAN